MTPADQLLAERLLAEKLVSPEKLEACRQTLRKAEHAGNPPSPLAQELLRQRLLPAWRIGLLLLELHSGFEDAREDSGGGPTAAAPSDPSAALARYPVSGQLGAGGMGQVLAIHDPALGREMAAKLIRGTASSTMKARFIQEAQITGRLEHPGIVPVHELGMTEDGRIYFTMKRVRGQDLSKSLAARPLFELLQILLKVCDALAYAHSQGVIHRDLKPANIMVGRFGEVQVVDWGLAKVVDEPDLAADGGRPAEEEADTGRAGKLPRTQAGAVLGTYPYMAPEQARGEIDRLDRRTDVYALGAVLYEMLAGCPPYGGSSHAQILARVLAGKLLPPGERAPDCQVPPELEAVTLKAMARRPAERYDTVVDMQRDIEAHLEGRLLQAAEYNTWQVVKKWAARHKPAVAAAAASLAAVILGFVASSWQLHQVRLARDNERQQKNVALAARKDEAAQRKKAELREQEAQIARKDALASRRKAVAALEERDRETREKEVAQRKGSAAEQVHKAMELYTGKGDRAMVSKLLAEAEQVYPDHSGLLRMRGRMALDRKEWPKARGLLERALKQDPKDYVTHFLLYRWHAQQGRGNTRSAEKHVWAAAKHGTQDSAIGLWGLGMREIDKAKKLYGSAKTKALEQGVEFCTRALAKRADFAWAFRTPDNATWISSPGKRHWQIAMPWLDCYPKLRMPTSTGGNCTR